MLLELKFLDNFAFEALVLCWLKIFIAEEFRVSVRPVFLFDRPSRCHSTPCFFLFFSFDILHEVIVQPNKVSDLKADVTMRLEAFALV